MEDEMALENYVKLCKIMISWSSQYLKKVNKLEAVQDSNSHECLRYFYITMYNTATTSLLGSISLQIH